MADIVHLETLTISPDTGYAAQHIIYKDASGNLNIIHKESGQARHSVYSWPDITATPISTSLRTDVYGPINSITDFQNIPLFIDGEWKAFGANSGQNNVGDRWFRNAVGLDSMSANNAKHYMWKVDDTRVVACFNRNDDMSNKMEYVLYGDANSDTFDFETSKLSSVFATYVGPTGYLEGGQYIFTAGYYDSINGYNRSHIVDIDISTDTVSFHEVVNHVNPPSTRFGPVKSIGMSGNRFLVVYEDFSNSSYLTAAIATVVDASTVSWGIPVIISSANSSLTDLTVTENVDGDRVMIAYPDAVESDYPTLRRIDVDGTNLSVSNSLVIDFTLGNYYKSIIAPFIDVSQNKFIALYHPNSNQLQAYVGSLGVPSELPPVVHNIESTGGLFFRDDNTWSSNDYLQLEWIHSLDANDSTVFEGMFNTFSATHYADNMPLQLSGSFTIEAVAPEAPVIHEEATASISLSTYNILHTTSYPQLNGDYSLSGFAEVEKWLEKFGIGSVNLSGEMTSTLNDMVIPTYQRPRTIWAQHLQSLVTIKQRFVRVDAFGEEYELYTTKAYFYAQSSNIKMQERRRLQNLGYKKIRKLLTGVYDIDKDSHFEVDGKEYRLIQKRDVVDHYDAHSFLYLEEL